MSSFINKWLSQPVYIVTPQQSRLLKALKDTSLQIHAGMGNPLSGTGTPISSLSGGARFTSILSNIGGGSKASGGGGMEAGMRLLDQHSRISGALQEILRQTGLPGKK